jgi:hypothetical protein
MIDSKVGSSGRIRAYNPSVTAETIVQAAL